MCIAKANDSVTLIPVPTTLFSIPVTGVNSIESKKGISELTKTIIYEGRSFVTSYLEA